MTIDGTESRLGSVVVGDEKNLRNLQVPAVPLKGQVLSSMLNEYHA